MTHEILNLSVSVWHAPLSLDTCPCRDKKFMQRLVTLDRGSNA